MWTDRVLNRLSREILTRVPLPPSWLGYRYLRDRDPLRGDALLIDPPGVAHVPLPLNIPTRDELPRDRGGWGFSMHDVPERAMEPTYIATVPNCRILSAPDEWGDLHYAIVDDRGAVLRVRGTGFVRELHAPLMKCDAVPLARATWILEQWDQNYSHWLQWHLVKIAMLQKHGRADALLLPAASRLAPVIDRSLQALGVDRAAAHTLSSPVVAVDRLTVAGMDHYRDTLAGDLRDRLVVASRKQRRLFISRAKAGWRRLRNEEACWPILESFGFERVLMEDYDFDEQRRLIGEAAVIAGPHGTGLANMIFAVPGLHVIEIYDAAFPNPQFYALAGALGHHYWLVRGTPAGDFRPGYHDIDADVAELRVVLAEVQKRK